MLKHPLSIHCDALLVDVVRHRGADAGAAFGVLVRRHDGRVRRKLAKILMRPQAVDDVLQEAFLRAYTQCDQLSNASAFSAWVGRIAERLALNSLRNGKTRRAREHEKAVQRLPRVPGDPGDRIDAALRIRSALDALPHGHREVLVMRYVEERTLVEIGLACEAGESAVKMRLKRAREAFTEAAMRTSAAPL